MTCPQCAIKHLSAALAYLADGADFNGNDAEVFAARAVVNLIEFTEGYRTHAWFAVGLMVKAEERAATFGMNDFAAKVREARMKFSDGSIDAAEAVLLLMAVVHESDLYVAHMAEAERELPGLDLNAIAAIDNVGDRAKAIGAEIEKINETYFPEETQERKGGESDMACKGKKVAKAAPKAAAKKAACKGGKTCKKCGK